MIQEMFRNFQHSNDTTEKGSICTKPNRKTSHPLILTECELFDATNLAKIQTKRILQKVVLILVKWIRITGNS